MMFTALAQVVDGLNQGVMVLAPDGTVRFWNRWLSLATGREARAVVGRNIADVFPEFSGSSFQRNFRSVISFGNFAFFSQKVHGCLFRVPPLPGSAPGFECMQQHCVMGPVIEEDSVKNVYLIVRDVTNEVFMERRLADLATKDSLTEAYNRRYFTERYREETERAKRSGTDFCIAIIDIDHFKAVNDTHGHQFGDTALRVISRLCMSSLRSYDTLARYGGEEFCMLLPETNGGQAEFLLNRLRAEISDSDITDGNTSARVTVSAGIAQKRPEDDMDTLFSRADKALYRAKETGRNRVVCAP